ncbi:MAG: HD domain-containing phosphohydrolase [bacterium]
MENAENIHKSRILVVDDETVVKQVVVDFLEMKGFEVVGADNGMEAMEKLSEASFDLILSDIRMPGMDGLELLKNVKKKYSNTGMIMFTGFADIHAAVDAMKLGAYDYVAKPFNFDELLMNVERALEKANFVKLTKEYQETLEKKVMEQAARIRTIFTEAVGSLTNAIEAKDHYTKGHSIRVTKFASWLAEGIDLEFEVISDIVLASQLHDIGKMGIVDEILNKPGKLTDEEFDIVRNHSMLSVKILEPILPEVPLGFVKHHHERWDGKGYPDGLSGMEIPIGARVIGVVDTFDAMTSKRAYRDALPVKRAFEEIERCTGSQFDPEIAPHFRAAYEKYKNELKEEKK